MTGRSPTSPCSNNNTCTNRGKETEQLLRWRSSCLHSHVILRNVILAQRSNFHRTLGFLLEGPSIALFSNVPPKIDYYSFENLLHRLVESVSTFSPIDVNGSALVDTLNVGNITPVSYYCPHLPHETTVFA